MRKEMKYRFACILIYPQKPSILRRTSYMTQRFHLSPITRNFRLLFRPNKSGCCISIFPLSCPAKLQSKHSSQQSPPPLDPRQHYFSCCRRQGLGAHPQCLTRSARHRRGWAKQGDASRFAIWSGIRQWINYCLLLLIRRPLD